MFVAQEKKLKVPQRKRKLNTLHFTTHSVSQEFRSMDPIKNQVKKKQDLTIRASDFVIEHDQSVTFGQYYQLDSHILGEGAFGKVQKCF